ncbi:hypothetical protein DVH24_034092 [Malus domestica]|uniref:H(+)-exporting diphosphatase n=1 Tax=Malus domestica TaxID=3750 RepID=A0A498KUS7_MALDO|nr:hypothetical protein DVH24_034092 [Malus domestica]
MDLLEYFLGIGVPVGDATDAARSASDIALHEPGLSVIISALLTCRAIFQRMNYTEATCMFIELCVLFSYLLSFVEFRFMFISLIWKFDFAPFVVLVIVILNDDKIFILMLKLINDY